MTSYIFKPGALSLAKANYQQGYLRSPREGKIRCGVIRYALNSLKTTKTTAEIFTQAAGIISKTRNNAALLAAYCHRTSRLEVMSAAGELADAEGQAALPVETPNLLMDKAVSGFFSVHVPRLAGLDRPTAAPGGSFDRGGFPAVLIGEAGQLILHTQYPADLVAGTLPAGFRPEYGSLLLTPLGIEGLAQAGLGFFLEFCRDRAFTAESIQQVRTYAALFTWQIAERMMNLSGSRS